jgi:DHA3 family tetracycline resistance protein-like MFS transporter
VRRLDPHRTWLLYSGGGALALAIGWTVAPVYFVREVGMSPLELVLAGTALEIAYFVFEVPTGVVADTYSRRTSIVVAQLVMGAGFLLTGAFADVGMILAAAALIGFGWTFKSGAEDAWLADEVGVERMARSYQRGAQVERALSLVGIGAAVGLALVDLRLPVLAGGVLLVALGLLLAVVMPESRLGPAPAGELTGLRPMARTARAGGRLIRARPVLLLILGIAFFGGMWSEGFDRLWEAQFLLEVGVPGFGGLDAVVWFGVLNAGSLLLALALARPLAHRFERAGERAMAGALLGLDSALLLGTLAFALAGSFVLAVGAFWAVQVARSLARPVASTWLNSNIDDSRVRATVISITNLGDSAGQWGGGPALGAIGSAFSIRAALAAGAAVLSPALWLYTGALRHGGGEPDLGNVAAAAGGGHPVPIE